MAGDAKVIFSAREGNLVGDLWLTPQGAEHVAICHTSIGEGEAPPSPEIALDAAELYALQTISQRINRWRLDRALFYIKDLVFPPTHGLSDQEIERKISLLAPDIEATAATGSARRWWEEFERENHHRPGLILRLMTELFGRRATITEFFLAYVYSDSDNIQANLDFLDFTRLRKQLPERPQAHLKLMIQSFERQLELDRAAHEAREWWAFAWPNAREAGGGGLPFAALEAFVAARKTMDDLFLTAVYADCDDIIALYFFDKYLQKRRSERESGSVRLSRPAEERRRSLIENAMVIRKSATSKPFGQRDSFRAELLQSLAELEGALESEAANSETLTLLPLSESGKLAEMVADWEEALRAYPGYHSAAVLSPISEELAAAQCRLLTEGKGVALGEISERLSKASKYITSSEELEAQILLCLAERMRSTPERQLLREFFLRGRAPAED